jgi:hypothetical protein
MKNRASFALIPILVFVSALSLSLTDAEFSYPSAMVEYGSDLVPPSVAIVSPKNKTYCVNNIALTFALNEAPYWIGYSLDGQANVTISGYAKIADLSIGSHSIIVYANSLSGVAGHSQTVYFTIDTVPPTITILSPEKNKTYSTNAVLLNFTVDEETSWSGYSIDGQETLPVSGNMNLPELSDGLHSLVVYAKDVAGIAGNTGTSETVYFSIAPERPDVLQLWVLGAIVVLASSVSAVLIYRLKASRRAKKQPTDATSDPTH